MEVGLSNYPNARAIIGLLLNLHMVLQNDLRLIELTDLNFFLVQGLVVESRREGHEFVRRTIDDWNSNANRFANKGEKLWGLISGNELIGIGGLNRDPYADIPNVGRVRHLYIREAHRRKGHATLLMNVIIDQARQHFAILRLFTENPAAAKFYETLGFERVSGHKVSHTLILNQGNQLIL
jgi:GNAT superfamily N-acetyltransferase